MPLFLVFIIFNLCWIEQDSSETHCITLTNFDDAGDAVDVI